MIAYDCILIYLKDNACELIDCFAGKRNQTSDNRQYSETVREFALQLHAISPRGYKFVREKFNKSLPHASTLRKWYAKSECNGRPGFITEALTTIKSMAKSMKEEGNPFLISISLDEIHIRKHLQWLHDKKLWSGYVSYGELVDDKLPIAGEAIVFMATCLRSLTSIPIAYHFIVPLTANEKKNLLLQVLARIHEIDGTVVNITLDGLKANIFLCQLLGASIDVDDPKPYFIDPASEKNIYILFDPSHMLKLMRNTLGDLSFIRDPSRGKIEWIYYERLERLRVKNKFLTHRITKKHIQYYRNRMNVRLAAQTFSMSTASSMRYLSNKMTIFKNSGATIFFTETMNNLFDTMNSKKPHKNVYFKNPIDESNASNIFSFFESTVSYLKTLKFNRLKCVDSRRKTGFIGFILNTYTIRGLFNDYVRSGQLQAIRVLYHSQDVLESFFSRIRYMGQWNDNPTEQQFESAIRKLTFLCEIQSSEYGNCDDKLNLLRVSSFGTCRQTQHESVMFETEMFADNENNYGSQYLDVSIETLEDASIAFIANQIETKIQNGRFECDLCANVLELDFKVNGDIVENGTQQPQRPCVSTFIICKKTHTIFDSKSKDINFNYRAILKSIYDSISYNELFANSDFSHDPYHKKCFIDFIIDEYVRSHSNDIAQSETLALQEKMIRSQNR